MLTLPGLGNPPGTPETRGNARMSRLGGIVMGMAGKPKPSVSPPPIDAFSAEEERRKKAAKAAQNSTVLTSPSGVLGDPPLDRPVARSATVLG